MRRRSALFALALCLGVLACESTEPLPPAVLVTPTSLTLEDGRTAKLTASLRNPRVSSRTVRWTSSNTAVATVDVTGNVTGVTNGSATITVRMVEDSTLFTNVPVTVSGPAVATVTVSPAAVTVFVGLARQIFVSLRAADGRLLRGRRVTWTTPDPTIAEVTTSGIVRGRGPGGPIALEASAEGVSASALVRVAHDAEVCPFSSTVSVGQRVEGRLTLGDCEYRGDESYVDVYEFTLATAATVQIDMTSTEIDSYLGLFNATGPFIAEDNDSGGEHNARIVWQLNAGRYHIWANTTTGATSGTYALLVTQR